jgi:predicted Zn finger-like uncharacterized protein
MSLKTRCPACETVFKIVPDQLKVSSGWVRCGRCAEVFDAASHAAASDDASLWPQNKPPEVVVTSTVVTVKNPDFAPKTIAVKAINTPASVDLISSKEQNSTDLSFVRIAKNKAFWQRRSVITSLRAACVGLAGLLFFQVVFSQRNHIAAANPAFTTTFESLCQAIGCKIEPFQNIDAFKIDSSSFQKSQQTSADATLGENFALKLTIKNNTELAVAMPAVELTLTDTNDKPVLRRVLLAKDLGFNADTLAANSDWNGAVTLAVTPSSSMAPITGYRVLLFYP